MNAYQSIKPKNSSNLDMFLGQGEEHLNTALILMKQSIESQFSKANLASATYAKSKLIWNISVKDTNPVWLLWIT